jgi:hypothetical protein
LPACHFTLSFIQRSIEGNKNSFQPLHSASNCLPRKTARIHPRPSTAKQGKNAIFHATTNGLEHSRKSGATLLILCILFDLWPLQPSAHTITAILSAILSISTTAPLSLIRTTHATSALRQKASCDLSSTERLSTTSRHTSDLSLTSPTTNKNHSLLYTMFPADCLPTHYLEARTQQDLAHQKATAAAEKRPTHLLAQPTPQRPTMTRALSSALFSFFPSASTSTSPSATPLPSPGLSQGLSQGSKMGGWFGVLPRADESDIAVSVSAVEPVSY